MPYLLCFARLLYELSSALSSIIFYTNFIILYFYCRIADSLPAGGGESFRSILWVPSPPEAGEVRNDSSGEYL